MGAGRQGRLLSTWSSAAPKGHRPSAGGEFPGASPQAGQKARAPTEGPRTYRGPEQAAANALESATAGDGMPGSLRYSFTSSVAVSRTRSV